MPELESSLVQELRKEIAALKKENEAIKEQKEGVVKTLVLFRKRKHELEALVADQKKQIQERDERIAELEDIDYLGDDAQ